MQHTQAIQVNYIGATDTQPSKVKLMDKRFNTQLTQNYSYEHGDIKLQAKAYLEAKGYTVHTYSTINNGNYLLTVSHGKNSFKNIREA